MINRIKKIMASRQFNAAQFADEIGIKRSALSHVLSGRNNPSLDFMLKIKHRFPEINLDWLLMGSGSVTESAKTTKNELVSGDLFTQTVERKEQEEKSIKETHGAAKEVVINEVPEQNVMQKVEKKVPKQLILLYNDDTFELFNNIPESYK